jgi:hypothetical protein
MQRMLHFVVASQRLTCCSLVHEQHSLACRTAGRCARHELFHGCTQCSSCPLRSPGTAAPRPALQHYHHHTLHHVQSHPVPTGIPACTDRAQQFLWLEPASSWGFCGEQVTCPCKRVQSDRTCGLFACSSFEQNCGTSSLHAVRRLWSSRQLASRLGCCPARLLRHRSLKST